MDGFYVVRNKDGSPKELERGALEVRPFHGNPFDRESQIANGIDWIPEPGDIFNLSECLVMDERNTLATRKEC